MDSIPVVVQQPTVQTLGNAQSPGIVFPERHFPPFETKTVMKKLFGQLYFFLGGKPHLTNPFFIAFL
ncbi:MAG: hypothetical protein ABIA12_02210 [Candidatus Aenigmatarchaeota archaeon]